MKINEQGESVSVIGARNSKTKIVLRPKKFVICGGPHPVSYRKFEKFPKKIEEQITKTPETMTS